MSVRCPGCDAVFPTVHAPFVRIRDLEMEVADIEAENAALRAEKQGIDEAFQQWRGDGKRRLIEAERERDALRAERDAAVGLLLNPAVRVRHVTCSHCEGLARYSFGVDESLEAEATRQQKRDEALAAAKALLDRLDFIHADGAYQAVWNIYTVHSGQYKGPTYVEELAALRAALAEPTDADERSLCSDCGSDDPKSCLNCREMTDEELAEYCQFETETEDAGHR